MNKRQGKEDKQRKEYLLHRRLQYTESGKGIQGLKPGFHFGFVGLRSISLIIAFSGRVTAVRTASATS